MLQLSFVFTILEEIVFIHQRRRVAFEAAVQNATWPTPIIQLTKYHHFTAGAKKTSSISLITQRCDLSRQHRCTQ